MACGFYYIVFAYCAVKLLRRILTKGFAHFLNMFVPISYEMVLADF
jgi:hypothetical protein